MRKITLLTVLYTLIGVVAFAQKDLGRLPMEDMQSPSPAFKCLDRHTIPATQATMNAEIELVTPPATAQVETWYTIDGKFIANSPYGVQDFTSMMPTINVAIDGSDIYIQGLAYYFRDGWIKGTIDGNKASFPNGQVVGEDDFGIEYFCGANDAETLVDNIVFNYDAEAGLMESATIYLLENSNATEPSPYSYWYRPVFSKTEPASKLVSLPEGVVAEDWVITYHNNMDVLSSASLKIGFDGSDVYLQGLNSYIPEAWIKGSLNGTTLTFPGSQYFGFHNDTPYSGYDMYLQEDDIVFTYDAEANKMTAVNAEITVYTSTLLKADIYKNAVITKVIEKATTPATPNISQIYDSSTGPVVLFSVPVLDVDGNGIVATKLTFQFLSDIEQEITPVTFDPADYASLNEAMSVFPYGFTDDTELFPTYMYLKQADYSKWNKLGIQSIYTGGGEENKSEIFWCFIKDYQAVTFNFNAMTEEPCSSNDSDAGNITEDRQLKEGAVTLTVSPNPEGTPNRFWSTNNGPQLRVYGGTLTFEAAPGKILNKIVFNNAKWNNNNSADTGAFDGSTWTGEAQKVVVTIAGNTQLNSINVIPSDFVPTAIEAPENLVTDTYVLQANSLKPYYDPAELTLWLKVGFDGDDAYIQGLAADVNSSADQLWVKGTKNDAGQYVIPANQFMGSVSFWMSNNDYYFTALDAEGKMTDVVFDYDAEKSLFTTAQTLVLNALSTDVYAYQTFTDVTITKFNEVAASPSDPTIKSIDFGEWSSGISCTIPSVSSTGETLNPQKLFYTVWIEKDGQQAPYTFKTDMYYGVDQDTNEVPYSFNYSTWDGSHNIYFQDGVEECGTWTKVGIQSVYYGGDECNKSAVAWIDTPNASAINDIEADLEAGKAEIYNIAGQRLGAPQKGLNIINGRKVMVK
ncbi:MAG: hypothetical protein J5529_01375 [Prevotella sp.]|nr:hypothetical protein [Prevotella sp.]